ncbi:unnamed protein product, partial [Mesorhabditis spiculigera]
MTSGILILGSGGREHAIAWKLAQTVQKVRIAPGNGSPFGAVDLDISDPEAILAYCAQDGLDLVVVGPEIPLAQGIVDKLQDRIAIFGPTQEGARLETSKAFAKTFMQQNGIPTAEFAEFTLLADALNYIERCSWDGIVVKADGLAAGKGVVVCTNKEEAREAARNILQRLLEKDAGPNTGGMGVVGPVTVPKAIDEQISAILHQTIKGLQEQRIFYTGIIYAGFMITSKGPYVLEYNCRFGDPETELFHLIPMTSSLFMLVQRLLMGSW